MRCTVKPLVKVNENKNNRHKIGKKQNRDLSL